MCTRRSGIGLILAVLALAACTPGWHTFDPTTPVQPRPSQVIQFTVADTLVRLHGVHLSADSITGVPWLAHIDCDSCRVAYSLAQTSAMQTGDPSAGAWNLMIPVVAFGLFVSALAAAFAGYST